MEVLVCSTLLKKYFARLNLPNMHIEKFYYNEGTLRQASKSAQNSDPSLNYGICKEIFAYHYPGL